jgi:hypothetical protein
VGVRARSWRLLAVIAVVCTAVALEPGAAPAQGPLPELSIWEVVVDEGDGGDVSLTFEIELSAPSSSEVEVTFNTADGSATAPADYTSHTELVSIPAGSTSASVTVTGHGDTLAEDHEYLIAYLADPVGAVNLKDVAYGTLAEDDIPDVPTVRTVAGSGDSGCCRYFFLALGQDLGGGALTIDTDDRLVYTHLTGPVLARFVRGGVVNHVGGTPPLDGPCGDLDGYPAASTAFSSPYGIAALPDGSLLVATTYNHEIKRITPDGTIYRFAGLCPRRNTVPLAPLGDGGPARDARLDTPRSVSVGPDGHVYISDSGQHRLRRVDPGGTITTVAGTGVAGSSGDGGPAAAATLGEPWGIAFSPTGDVYVADHANHRVRRITPAGTIHTVAGTGTAGFSGDGGPATSARLNQPTALAVDSHGVLYIADFANHVIRRVALDGTISTVIGTPGVRGYDPDETDPSQAPIGYPLGLVVDDLDRLYVSSGDGVILEVSGL